MASTAPKPPKPSVPLVPLVVPNPPAVTVPLAPPMPKPPAVTIDQCIPGYPKLAAQMELIPETMIFRRFGALNSQILLYQQAELAALEIELRELEAESSRSADEDQRKYARDFHYLDHCEFLAGEGVFCEQWQLVKKIEERLKAYNKALLRQAAIVNMQEPAAFDLNDIQHYLVSKQMQPGVLLGDDSNIWGTVDRPKYRSPDLLALRPRQKTDMFSNWVSNTGLLWFFKHGGHRFRKPSQLHGMVAYLDSTLLRLTFWVTTIVASLLPVASIAILYSTSAMTTRLVLVGVFNVVLSVCLTVFTTVGRSEIFAVSSAFSAVQVVFIAVENYT